MSGKKQKIKINKKELWPKMFKPVVVLLVICIVVSGLLGVTNHFTAPLIEEAKRKAANAARFELLPEAEDFEQIEFTADGLVDFYKSTNDVGYVITAKANGYGGEVPVMVAFDANGTICGITVQENNETPGLGKKAELPEFTDQFKGMPSENFTLADINAVAGATITSGAVTSAVNTAITAYNEVVKGVVVQELTPQEICAGLLPQSGAFTQLDISSAQPNTITVTTAEGASDHKITVTDAFKAENGDIAVFVEAEGYETHPLKAVVAFDSTGTVIALNIDASQQTQGLGTKVGEDDFVFKFIGLNSGFESVDNVASATVSSNVAKGCVQTAANFALANTSAADETAADALPQTQGEGDE